MTRNSSDTDDLALLVIVALFVLDRQSDRSSPSTTCSTRDG
jgi:hypothetical protein